MVLGKKRDQSLTGERRYSLADSVSAVTQSLAPKTSLCYVLAVESDISRI